MVPIDVQNLTFKYPEKNDIDLSLDKPLLVDVCQSWPQGGLYCLAGPPHEGKSTLLKLLGQVCLPPEDAGTIFVPPHLRILHMHEDLLTLRGSLLKNIIMNNSLQRVGGIARVKKICSMLNFEPQLMKYLDYDEEDDMDWRFYLTDSSSTRLTLARAFVMNPEVLLIHKPTRTVNAAETELFINMLRKHVEEKGIEMPVDDRRARRPRTVFFTTPEDGWIEGPDVCYEVSEKNGIMELEAPEPRQQGGKNKGKTKNSGNSPKNGGNSPKNVPPPRPEDPGNGGGDLDFAAPRSSSSLSSASGGRPADHPRDRERVDAKERKFDRSSSQENPATRMGPGKPKRSSVNQEDQKRSSSIQDRSRIPLQRY
jgi:energy-coupling factor transporter ATP-binding protein EcfA2